MSDTYVRPFNKEVKDLRGNRYGMLTVIDYAGVDSEHRSHWRCRCDCGKEITALGKSMRMGNKKSCGCGRAKMISDSKKTHGKTDTREFRIWTGIKTRTTNPNSPEYRRYGARGIKMCERWMNSFPAFLEDMGKSPTKDHSIDRIDNNGDYCPENCRWATRLEQGKNKRNNVFCMCNGVRVHLAEAGRMLGRHQRQTYKLVERGLVALCQ